MAIRGDLLSAELSNVFQLLALNRKRGRLIVRDLGDFLAQRRLFINEDRVAFDDTPHERPLVGLLVEMGIITYAQYKSAADKAERYRSEPLQLLRQQGLVTDQHLLDTARRIQEEEILEVFLWRNVSFRLEEGSAASHPADDFNIDQLIIEAARRQDEWRHFTDASGLTRRIFIQRGLEAPAEDAGIGSVARIVLDRVDGVRGSRQIMDITGLPRYFVDIALRDLQVAGLIEPLGLAELISAGDGLAENGRPEDAVRLFRAAMQFDRQSSTLHRRLGLTLLSVGRIAKAAAHFRFCASLLLLAGHRAEAIAVGANVLKILPTDFRSIERYVEAVAEEADAGSELSTEAREIVVLARKLCAYYLETGQDEAALVLAERLTRIETEDEELLGQKAKLLVRAGRRADAAAAYRALAERHVQRDDVKGALEFYRIVSDLEPENRHLYEGRSHDLERRDQKATRRTLRRRLAIAGFVLLTGTLALGYGYDRIASSEFDGIEWPPGATVEGCERIAGMLDRHADSWPFTRSSNLARSRALLARKTSQEISRKAASSLAQSEREASQLLLEAKGLVVKAEQALRRRPAELDLAERVFKEARGAAEKAGTSDALVKEIDSKLADVSRYLADGRQLLSDAAKAEASRDRTRTFELRARAFKEFPLLPECTSMVVPLLVTTIPDGGSIRVETGSDQFEGSSPMEVPLQGLSGNLVVIARRAGCDPVRLEIRAQTLEPQLTIAIPSTAITRHSAKARIAGAASDAGGPIVVLQSDGHILVASEDGGMTRVPGEREILSVAGMPLVTRNGVVVLSRLGEVRHVRTADGGIRWRVRPLGESPDLMPPVLAGDLVVIAERGGRIVVLDASGGEVRADVRTEGRITDLRASKSSLVARLESGGFECFDPATGRRHERVDRSIEGEFGVLDDGRVIALSEGRVTVLAGGAALAAPPEGGASPAALLVAGASRVVMASGTPGLIVLEDGRLSRIALPEPAVRCVLASGGRGIAFLKSGSVAVVDFESSSVRIVAKPAAGPAMFAVLHDRSLLIADAEGEIGIYRLP